MFFLLPIIAFILVFLVISKTKMGCWRSALLFSALVWGVIVVALTETLSLFKALSFMWLLGSWALICLSLIFIGYQIDSKALKGKGRTSIGNPFAELIRFINIELFSSKIHIRVWVLGILGLVLIVGIVALIAPPNTNDSMGYHMPRVMHWIQNRSVAHFPTNYTAQLFLSPWSTFAISHFQILSNSDRYANLIQFFSMVGSIIGVSLIAEQLGATIYGQLFASVFCATIPMGILQGSSTQNDYVVSFWLVCLVYYILLSLRNELGKGYYWQIGLSLGLATFAKPTTYLYAFPFLIWILVENIKWLRWQVLRPASLVSILVVVVNGSHWARNWELFQHPLGKSPDYIIYTNRAFSIPIFLSNILRNIALHFSTPAASINQLLIKGLSFIHGIIGADINDPRTSSSAFQLNSLINQEDLAANTIHLLLIFVSIACLSYSLQKKAFTSTVLKYLICIVSGFLLFCVLLAWTPFHTRLHLALFVLSSAFVGCVFTKTLSLRLVNLIAIILIVLSSFWLFFNETRPLIANGNFIKTGNVENIFNTSRTDLYFVGRRYFRDPMIGATDFIKSKQCSNIGITFDKLDIFEYPLWALLKTDSQAPYRIQHVAVNNVSKIKEDKYFFKDFNPCMIFDAGGDVFERMPDEKNNYSQGWSDSRVTVYVRK